MAKRRKTVELPPTENEKAEERVKKQKRLPKRQGVLRYIKDVPLDVLFEILGFLDPLDILRLSRTSKALRHILLSRSSTSVWKTARRNLGVPDPIPSMSEPAFANLLFDPHCHFCLTATVRNISWWAGLRCCKTCLPIYFASDYEIQARGLLTNLAVPDILWKTLPRYLLDTPSGQKQWRKLDEVYLISGAEELSPHISGIVDEIEESVNWLVNRLTSLVADIEQSNKCRVWMDGRTAERERELSDARLLRFHAIVVKLEAMGWEDELAFPSSRRELRQHKLVKQPKELTDRIWQNIEQPLADFMESVKADRLKREHKAICEKRYKLLVKLLRERESVLSGEVVMPSSVDVACWEPFNAVIETLSTEAGAEASMFDEALEQLPKLIQEWNREKPQMLLTALKEHKPEATEADLHLATSIFQCQTGFCMANRVAAYPAILTHRGAHGFFSNFSPPRPWLPWGSQRFSDCELKVHKAASEISRSVMQLCGLDPSTTTTEKMFALNPLLECKDCTTESGVRIFMRWNRALTHGLHHGKLEVLEFVLASEEERNLVESHEASLDTIVSRQHKDKLWYRCNQCNFRATMADIKAHLTELHGIENPAETDWTFRFMGYLNLEGPYPVRVIPPGIHVLDEDFLASDLYI
ncbi:hypothetical protein L218DRAFT_924350 [Marasmius fiardii PR-910]|nr:hypothetical protein L218DRAFT_924350 [Marasmius fiardii PR-910]